MNMVLLTVLRSKINVSISGETIMSKEKKSNKESKKKALLTPKEKKAAKAAAKQARNTLGN
jgi:hypothetical protein